MGILVCGLNGSGKSTFGRALAEELGFSFLDKEDFYFVRTDAADPYAAKRPPKEAERLFLQQIAAHPRFVYASVRGDYGEEPYPFFGSAILMEAPKEVRLQRIRERSRQRFGSRVLPGGDLYEREEAFFQAVASREESFVQEWLRSLCCPVLCLDGTKPAALNISLAVGWLQSQGLIQL